MRENVHGIFHPQVHFPVRASSRQELARAESGVHSSIWLSPVGDGAAGLSSEPQQGRKESSWHLLVGFALL